MGLECDGFDELQAILEATNVLNLWILLDFRVNCAKMAYHSGWLLAATAMHVEK